MRGGSIPGNGKGPFRDGNWTGNVGMVNFKKARERMVETQIAARSIHDERVLEAMRKVPRHLFVDEALRDQAYSDHPLPIAEKQDYFPALYSGAYDREP